jgi:hypothetical protein
MMRKALTALCVVALFGPLAVRSVASSTPRGPEDAPVFDPANFSSPAENPYFPLEPGIGAVYKGTKEGEPQLDRVHVTDRTKEILGVVATVVSDVVTHRGTPLEKTHDWYAADNDGNVWYLGEDTVEYDENGNPVSREGSWEAGVDGAIPGIIMLADPQVTDAYRQEFSKGTAEDQAWVVRRGESVTVPYGKIDQVIRTLEWSRLEPEVVAVKLYGPGLGIIAERSLSGEHETSSLVRFTT